MNALKTGVFSLGGVKVMYEIAMAPNAIVLEYFSPPWGDKDRFREILKSKPLGMAIPIVRLRNILGGKRLGQMAFHTGGRGVMAGLLP